MLAAIGMSRSASGNVVEILFIDPFAGRRTVVKTI
jgi:hypothetical protein